MAERRTHALSDLLDELEGAVHDDSVAVQDIVERLGQTSFASLMLVASLVSTSPASAIPGVTATVAVVVFILAAQMMLGRKCVWLPGVLTRRRLESETLCKMIGWTRRPARFLERFLGARLTFLIHRPWLYVPLACILGLTLVMPFMELIPASGSIASAVIALFAAGLLVRDGMLVLLALVPLLSLPMLVWQFGFA